ncbi:GNAT acetyltransferase 2 domain-containing protein [Ditylenchus destructor]|uniref:GNAT acetyltransferase 2 domain-containing protein n=1 Tax=Ditylenchus destructor TaxID=166010 RepID=A0AAD4N7X1_9BILA|nr:GNAT acetyltransferase 2 domain-containing protein [Ditylenchus destructor]
MLSDAPAHHVFVLMPPVQENGTKVPQILAVVQICLEGSLSKKSATDGLEKGKRAAGDLIPWTLSQQFLDNDFPTLTGARIVRVAVHPDFQGMGYGSRAMQLVHQYYNGDFYSVKDNNASMDTEINVVRGEEETDEFLLLDEEIEPRTNLPPLLLRLAERPAEQLDYIGVSFGLTIGLLKFWKRLKYVPVYLRQTTNDLTGEHTCIMLKRFAVDVDQTSKSDGTWLPAYFREFRHRFIPSLGFSFCSFLPHTVLSLLDEKVALANTVAENKFLTREELRLFLPDSDLKRLSQFSRSMADKSLIMDLLPVIASIYFSRRVDLDLDYRQAAVLLCVGLQRKTVEKAAEELDLPVNQTYSFLFKGLHRLSAHFDTICKQAIEAQIMPASRTEHMESMLNEMEPTAKSLEEDLREAEREIKERQARDKKNLKKELGAKLINEFAIHGDDDEWQDAVGKINLTQAKSEEQNPPQSH